VLTELARQVRGDTLQVLDATQADWLNWAPPGTSNPLQPTVGKARAASPEPFATARSLRIMLIVDLLSSDLAARSP